MNTTTHMATQTHTIMQSDTPMSGESMSRVEMFRTKFPGAYNRMRGSVAKPTSGVAAPASSGTPAMSTQEPVLEASAKEPCHENKSPHTVEHSSTVKASHSGGKDAVAAPTPTGALPAGPKPIGRVIRLSELLALIGLSRSTVYSYLDPESPRYDPTFPRRLQLGWRMVGWLEVEVHDWIMRRAAARPNE